MILSIETSTDVCSVALSHEGTTVAHLAHFEGNAHASTLTPLIERLMEQTNTPMKSLVAVAVSSGPGSYTGLRIGASTAKGICYALNIPLIAVPTLDLMAHTLLKENSECRVAVPMIDARRMEVYTQAVTRSGEKVMDVASVVVDGESFADLLAKREGVFFGGNGMEKCKEVIGCERATYVSGLHPLAKDMAALAYERLKNNQTESVAYFEPFYLKEFVATVPKNKVF